MPISEVETMKQFQRLCTLRPGESAVVRALDTRGAMRLRLRELGLIEGAVLRCLGRSPLGDPAAYELCGAALALRDRDSREIWVERREEKNANACDRPCGASERRKEHGLQPAHGAAPAHGQLDGEDRRLRPGAL